MNFKELISKSHFTKNDIIEICRRYKHSIAVLAENNYIHLYLDNFFNIKEEYSYKSVRYEKKIGESKNIMISDFYSDLEKGISEKLLIAKYIITQVNKWWEVLRFQERVVIFYRFIDLELDEGSFKEIGETRKQISQRLNVSEREVRTIENKAISKILNLN